MLDSVPRITKATTELAGQLESSGVLIPATQLQGAIEDGLGPLDRDSDTEVVVGHFRELVPHLGKGRSADVAAIQLAIAGYLCSRLSGAVKRLRAVTDPPDQDPEGVAEELMSEARTSSDDKPYGVRIAGRLLTGSNGSGTQWDAPTEDHEDLHNLGQAQAVLTGFSEMAEGAPVGQAIDADDVARVLGVAPGIMSAYVQILESVFGPRGAIGNENELIDEAEPAVLMAAVIAAYGILPLYESLVCPLGSDRLRWICVAQLTPLMLTMGDLLRVAVKSGGDDLVIMSGDLLASLPAISPEAVAGLAALGELTP